MFDDLSPIYLQIAERIRGEVLAGTLGADDPVMSTNQYAEFYGINPATAAKASWYSVLPSSTRSCAMAI